MNLIIPAAGKSNRFPGVRPKWLLVHPSGNLMVAEAIKQLPLENVTSIYLIILREHVEQYNCLEGIKRAFNHIGVLNKLHVVVLEEGTRNQPETVAKAIEKVGIDGPIFIKDSDNTFCSEIRVKNGVSVFDLNKMNSVNPSNKSYVTLGEHQMINNIVEKQVINSLFCAGGYSFTSSKEYLNVFNELRDNENLYVSHIIFKMLLNNVAFEPLMVSGYEDWGTIEDWGNYKRRYNTIFIDLDGVLVENSGEYLAPFWGDTPSIKENVEALNRLYNSDKVRIIITTTRKAEFRDITLKQLEREGIKYHDIIFDLYHSNRIVINDYARSNPYKSCDAINIKRDSNDLKEMLEGALGFHISE